MLSAEEMLIITIIRIFRLASARVSKVIFFPQQCLGSNPEPHRLD
jgi:hypothetical protein